MVMAAARDHPVVTTTCPFRACVMGKGIRCFLFSSMLQPLKWTLASFTMRCSSQKERARKRTKACSTYMEALHDSMYVRRSSHLSSNDGVALKQNSTLLSLSMMHQSCLTHEGRSQHQ